MLNWMDVNQTFRDLDLFRREMDRMFNQAVRDELRYGGALSEVGRDVGAYVEATDKAFVLTVDLPGVAPEDIDLQVTREGLTLRAERKVVPPESYSTHRQERRSWRFSRSWTLPVPIDVDETVATVANGMLTVTLPKAAEVQPRRIDIKA